MILVHLILNLACLLLWVNWRSVGFVEPNLASQFSLLSTLKRTKPQAARRWLNLISLGVPLVVGSLFYWQMGSATNWTPIVDLVAITLPFRSDYFLLMLLFSVVSFGLWLAGFYAWLLLISAANRSIPDMEPMQKLLRFHLGWLEQIPAAIKLALPSIVALLSWVLSNASLARLGIIPSTASSAQLWQQSAVVSLASVMVWEFLLLGLLVLHLLNSYVYLGNASFWSFVNVTARNILRPISWLSPKVGKVELAPIVGIALILVGAALGKRWLPVLYQRLPL